MGWAETKAKMHRKVHLAFSSGKDETGLSRAQYTAPNAEPIPVSVRFHSEVKLFGDLDREGYTKVLEDVSHLVFMREEVVPVRNGFVSFLDGSVYDIENVLPSTDPLTDQEIVCEVVLRRTP